MTINQTSEAGEMLPSLCPHCKSPKTQAWHLICDKCWPLVPDQLTAELIASHKEGVGSPRHWTACQEVLRFLEEDHGLKAMAMMTPIKGLVHVCTVRGDDGWEAICCLWDGERWLYWDDALEPKGWEPVTDMNCIVEAWDLPIMPGSPAYRTESHLRAQLAEAEKEVGCAKAWRDAITAEGRRIGIALGIYRDEEDAANSVLEGSESKTWRTILWYCQRYGEVLKERDALRGQLAEVEGRLRYSEVGRVAAVDDRDGWRLRAKTSEAERDAAQARVGALESALREARPFVIPTDHEGRSEDELRECYPDSCAAIDRVRTRIDAALAGGAVQ